MPPRLDQRQELFDCYVASGADTDGCGPEHLNPGDALRAVQELRKDYDESVDWEGIARELARVLEEAHEYIPDGSVPSAEEAIAADLWAQDNMVPVLEVFRRASLGEE